MGNSESLNKLEYTNEQLRQSEKADLQLLSVFSEKVKILDESVDSNSFLGILKRVLY
jgi:hypothetical protein